MLLKIVIKNLLRFCNIFLKRASTTGLCSNEFGKAKVRVSREGVNKLMGFIYDNSLFSIITVI